MTIKSKIRTFLMVGVCPMIAVTGFAQESAVRNISKIEVDEAKLREAVASRVLTWLTGRSSNNDYVSVGRLANFLGSSH